MRKRHSIDRSKIRRVVLYARVSSDQQAEKETPIEGQLVNLREYAQKEGWDVVGEFVDRGRSGRSDRRPEFQRMIAYAKETPRPFDAVLVWKFNRFGRNTDDLAIYRSILRKKCGIDLISMNEPIEDGHIGKLIECMLAAIDEFFSANLAGDCFRGMEVTARQGYRVGGNVPIGYHSEKKIIGTTSKATLVLDDVYAPVIQRIFQMYLSGIGTKDAAKTLNTEGVLAPKGKPWTAQKINYILRNEVYVGVLAWNRMTRDHEGRVVENAPEDVIRIEDAVPAIIDRETYDIVQARLDAANPRRPDAVHSSALNSDYLLSGLLRCRCGGAMTGAEAKSGRYHYYECTKQAKAGKTACAMKRIPQSVLEGAVLEYLTAELLTEKHIGMLLSCLQDENNGELEQWQERLRVVEREIADVRRKLNGLYDALEEGAVSHADIGPRLRERREQLVALEETQRQLKSAIANPPTYAMSLAEIRAHVIEWRKTLAETAPREKKAFLQSFMERITLDHEEHAWIVSLKYKFPAPIETSAGNQVLDCIQVGRAYGNRTRRLRLERPTS